MHSQNSLGLVGQVLVGEVLVGQVLVGQVLVMVVVGGLGQPLLGLMPHRPPGHEPWAMAAREAKVQKKRKKTAKFFMLLLLEVQRGSQVMLVL